MDENVERPLLRRLSARLGIVDSYLDQTGVSLRQTSDETRERLLCAMGFDVSTEEGAGKALRRLRREKRREWIAPVRVVRQMSKSLANVRVLFPATHAHEIAWHLTLTTEEEVRWQWSGTTHGGARRRMTLDLPVKPPLGYHDLEIHFTADGREWRAKQRLIVVIPNPRFPCRRSSGAVHRGGTTMRRCFARHSRPSAVKWISRS